MAKRVLVRAALSLVRCLWINEKGFEALAVRTDGYARMGQNHSHSIVPGGFEVMS